MNESRIPASPGKTSFLLAWDRAVTAAGVLGDTRPGVVAAVLLVAFGVQASLSLINDSVTFDETAHVAAGYVYLDRADFRLNPEHPPLAKLWCALPLRLLRPGLANYESRSWKGGNQWAFGSEFLNSPPGEGDSWGARGRVVSARLPMVVLGMLLGWVVYAWSREIWGVRGALLALFLYTFSPAVLAHARLVTTDLPAALGFTLSLWTLWRYFRQPGLVRGICVGLSLGVALLVKFSTVLLLPSLVLLVLLWVFPPGGSFSGARKKLVQAGSAAALILMVAWGVLWAGYGFRYSAVPDGSSSLYWPSAELDGGPVAGLVALCRSHRLLPEGYLYGFSYVLKHSQRETYLNGTILPHGSWLYLPEAFLLKSTPSVLLVAALSVALILLKYRSSFDCWYVLAPAALYFTVSTTFGMNIGHRHLLPVYPALFVLSGVMLRWAPGRLAGRVLIALVLAGHAASSLSSFPGYLSYFNLAAGGSANAGRYLVDSNLDWGQDLIRLGSWMKRTGTPSVDLIYFGTGEPRHYGVSYRKIYSFLDLTDEPAVRPRPGECLAVSVTLLQGLYVSSERVRKDLERIRREWKPIGRAGDSILIYRIPSRPGD